MLQNIKKEHLLYGVIAILILSLFGKWLFASDEEVMKDSLTNINLKVEEIQAYKQKVANELGEKVRTANEAILEQCGRIPEALKSGVDCTKFTQDIKLPEPKYNTWTATGGIAPVPSQPGKVAEHTLREFLKIPECDTRELNFNTKHKLPRYKLEWLAYDIPPCVKGEPIKVFSPLYGDDSWLIETVGYGANMGNYVVLHLKNTNLRVVYAHTRIKVWYKWGQFISPWYEFGITDISWESTWMHLHVEIWEGSDIASRERLWSTDYQRTDETKLMEHRQWKFKEDPEKKYWQAYEQAISLLHKREGLRLTAYPDYKGCSIWYGSRANSCDEVITLAEADKRLAYITRDLTDKIQKAFPSLHSQWQAALISFAYNCHKGWEDVKANGLQQHQLWCKKAWGEYLDELIERRKEEHRMIFWNEK